MGVRPVKLAVTDVRRIFFEQQLVDLGLGKEQIEKQTEEELEQSLEAIDDAIKHPEAFGELKLGVVSNDGNSEIVAVRTSEESLFEISALPLLLERKRLIIDRLRRISDDKKIEQLKNLAHEATEDEVREDVKQQLEKLKAEIQKQQEQSRELEQTRNQEDLKAKAEWAKLSTDLFERRSRVWRTFLEKESVATIVGGLLLILLTTVLLIAMFVKTQIPELINNVFLVILGYFFGQSASKVLARTDDKDHEE